MFLVKDKFRRQCCQQDLAGRSTQAAANARASDPGAAWRQALASSWRQALARVAPPWVASRVQVLPALAADSGPFGSRRARSGQDFAFGSVPAPRSAHSSQHEHAQAGLHTQCAGEGRGDAAARTA